MPKGSHCLADSASVAATIDEGLSAIVDELKNIRGELKQQTELLGEVSLSIEGIENNASGCVD